MQVSAPFQERIWIEANLRQDPSGRRSFLDEHTFYIGCLKKRVPLGVTANTYIREVVTSGVEPFQHVDRIVKFSSWSLCITSHDQEVINFD